METIHIKENAQLSFISANRQNPSGLGRVVRDSRGDFLKVVEEKDTNDEEKRISEVNTGCYLFDVTWLRSAIDKIELSDAEEFYVTSAMQIARGQNRKVNIVTLANSNEWLGVNTKKELEVANEHMLKRLKREKTPSVFFLDVDNTILDTEGLKVTINERVVDKLHNSLGLSLPKKQIINEFWKVYEKTRDQLGYISIPNICDEFASSIGEGYIAEAMKTVFYSLPFKDHLAHGARELLEFLQPRGEAVIFGDGDLVYQPVKINNLGLKGLVDDVFVFERKTAYVPELLEIYSGHNKIVVDDQVRVLEEFKKWDKNTICIWYKYGRYAKEKPNKSSYKPDYISADLREVLSFVKKLYD
jgi:FMN phosphatase YigB (HAD superfamily)